MEKVKRPRIKCKGEVIRYIQEKMKCSPTAIYQALSFFCNNEKAMRMREIALNRGGKIIYEEFLVV